MAVFSHVAFGGVPHAYLTVVSTVRWSASSLSALAVRSERRERTKEEAPALGACWTWKITATNGSGPQKGRRPQVLWRSDDRGIAATAPGDSRRVGPSW